MAPSRRPIILGTSLLLVTWTIFYFPRIFLLGFDADDWIYLVHWKDIPFIDRLHYLVQIVGARPGSVVLLAAYPFAAQASPQISQAVSAVASLTVAILLYRLILTLLRQTDSQRGFVAVAGSILWLLAPWSMGYTAWPSMISGLVATILFLLAWLGAIDPKCQPRQIALSAMLQFLSYVTYETYYGQFIVVLATIWYLGPDRSPLTRRLSLPAILFLLAQIAALAVNRAAALISPSSTKGLQFSPDRYLTQLKTLPRDLLSFLDSGTTIPEWILLCGILVIGVGGVAALLRRNNGSGQKAALAATLVLSLNLGVLVYVAAGYSFSFEHRASRVFLGVTISAVLMGSLLVSWASELVPAKWQTAIAATLFLVPLIVCAQGLTSQTVRWAAGWGSILTVVRSAPVAQLVGLRSGTAVIYDGETNRGGFTFLGNVELTSAIYWAYPETGIAAPDPGPEVRFSPSHTDYYGWYLPGLSKLPVMMFTTGEGLGYVWDGSTLFYEMPGHWLQATSASALRLWSAAAGDLRNVLACQPIYPRGLEPTSNMRNLVATQCGDIWP